MRDPHTSWRQSDHDFVFTCYTLPCYLCLLQDQNFQIWIINTHLGFLTHATSYSVLALQLTQFQTAVIMPRPAVAPDKRRRIARACDSCKRRKERCNGAHPCSICTRRRKELECNFSDTPARLLRPIHSSPGRLSYKPNKANCYEHPIANLNSSALCAVVDTNV